MNEINNDGFFETEEQLTASTQVQNHFGYLKIQFERSKFKYTDKVWRLGAFTLFEIKISGSVSVKSYKKKEDIYTFNIPLEGYFLLDLNQVKVKSKEMFVLSPAHSTNFSMPIGIKALVLEISKEDMLKALSDLMPPQSRELLEFPITGFSTRQVECLKNALLNITSCIDLISGQHKKELFTHNSEHYLQTLLLTILENNLYFTDLLKYSNVVNKSIEYMHKNINKKIDLTDLSEATKSSKRSLVYQFKKHTKVSPSAYLLELRLLKLRDLLKKEKLPSNILDLAANLGLNHPGRLAKVYKERFGELPSEAMKKY